MSTGGSGLTGWLSAISSKLSGTLAVSLPASYFDGSGNLKVNVEVGGGAGSSVPTGTAGAPNASVVSIQGVASGSAVAVSAAALPCLPARPQRRCNPR